MTQDADLYFAEDGTPRSGRFGDIYYSPQDGLAETRAVFLDGCRLEAAWSGGGRFTVLELGFGTGLNVVAALQQWVHAGCPGHLHIFTVEAFVIAREQAAAALANWPELAEFAGALLGQWPRKRRGFHHIDLPQWKVSITVALMDVRAALDAWEGRADAIFLDGFSPALNPDMWAEDVMVRVAARAHPGARLATFTVAGHVRRGLQAAGFMVEKRPGFGRKRERLVAWLPGEVAPAKAVRRIAVIGAGIAGASLAWQARMTGLQADIYDPEPGSGASGNAAGLVTPRLDAGDNAISALFADAFYYAAALYRRVCPQAILGEGVVQIAMTERDHQRFGRIAVQAGFAAGDLAPFETGARVEAAGFAGLRQSAALSIAPMRVLETLLADQTIIRRKVTAEALTGYDAIIIACGDGVLDLPAGSRLGLRPVRGQVETAELDAGLDTALAWGGYVVPVPDGVLFGATHDRDDRNTDLRKVSRQANIDNLAKVRPDLAAAVRNGATMTSRAAIRVTTRDHLPAMGEIAPGVYVLAGLGARGFCLAPLLAKALIAQITGHGAPLPADHKKLLSPYRLLLS